MAGVATAVKSERFSPPDNGSVNGYLRSAGRTTEIISVAGRGPRRSPMPQAAISKVMDGNARIRAEDWRSSFSIGCLQAICYTSPHPLHKDAWPAGAFVPAAHAMQLTGQCMTDDLEILIAEMARHQAHHHQCSLAEATRQIRALVAEAREEYSAAGAPYGDDDRGLCRWLLARSRLMPAT
jgi:hypothetical protein